MHRHQRDRILLGIRPSLHLAHRVGPIRPHVARECAQSAHVVGARHFQKEIDIGDGPFGAAPEALPQLRAYVERGDPIGEERVGRGGTRSSEQRLQRFQHGARERVPDRAAVGAQIKARQAIRPVGVRRQCVGDVEELALGEPDQRAAQQCAERERVSGVRERARERNQVGNLLAAEEALAGLGRYRNPAIFQRLLEAPEVRSRGRKERNVTGPARALAAIGVLVADHHVADEPAAGIGDAFRFRVAQHGRTRSLRSVMRGLDPGIHRKKPFFVRSDGLPGRARQ